MFFCQKYSSLWSLISRWRKTSDILSGPGEQGTRILDKEQESWGKQGVCSLSHDIKLNQFSDLCQKTMSQVWNFCSLWFYEGPGLSGGKWAIEGQTNIRSHPLISLFSVSGKWVFNLNIRGNSKILSKAPSISLLWELYFLRQV